MTAASIRNATPADVEVIRELAEKTWWPTYGPLLPAAQIRFMLDAIYNTATLTKVIDEGTQRFILLSDNRGDQGFAAYGPRAEAGMAYKLHKLYVLPDNQGKGYGKALIDEVCRRLRQLGIRTLDLNVNRYNPARSFYEKMGFAVQYEEDVPIGPYFMNDYVMRKSL